MRCPHCRKKIHSDDIYCIWCGASLRRQTRSDPWETYTPKTKKTFVRPYTTPTGNSSPHRRRPASTAPVEKSPLFKFGMMLPVVILMALMAIPTNLLISTTREPAFPHQAEEIPALPEGAQLLRIPLMNLDEASITANMVAVSSDYIELTYTAENTGNVPICCLNGTATAYDQTVPVSIYFEAEPGQTLTDTMYIETDLFTAVGIDHIGKLDLELTILDMETYEPVGSSHSRIEVALELSGERMTDFYQPLYEGPDHSLALVGYRSDPEFNGLDLYLVTENYSSEPLFLTCEPLPGSQPELDFTLHQEVSGQRTNLNKISLYDLPLSKNDILLSFQILLETAEFEPIAQRWVELTIDSSGTIVNALCDDLTPEL